MKMFKLIAQTENHLSDDVQICVDNNGAIHECGEI